MMVDSSASGYFIRLSEISKTSLSDSASDSEDDDDDESDDDDEDEAEDAVLPFFFSCFFSGVAFFAFSFDDFSVLDSGHLGEVEVSNFGSGFSSLVAFCLLISCSGSSF